MSTSALSSGSAPATCRENMHYGEVCGRPIHPAPSAVDPIPKCLMHFRDASKSDPDFQGEFDRILTQSGVGLADFTGFVFPCASYRKRTFLKQLAISPKLHSWERLTFLSQSSLKTLASLSRSSKRVPTLVKLYFRTELIFLLPSSKTLRCSHPLSSKVAILERLFS